MFPLLHHACTFQETHIVSPPLPPPNSRLSGGRTTAFAVPSRDADASARRGLLGRSDGHRFARGVTDVSREFLRRSRVGNGSGVGGVHARRETFAPCLHVVCEPGRSARAQGDYHTVWVELEVSEEVGGTTLAGKLVGL